MFINKILEDRIDELDAILEKSLSFLKRSPVGTLRISTSKKGVQYYHCTEDTGSDGKYIRKSDESLAAALAQKDYLERVVEAASREKYTLQRINAEKLTSPEEIYDEISVERRMIVTPIVLSDEEYIKQWKSLVFERKGFSDDAPAYYTKRGERVRSKSEILIADLLYWLGVPYHYEKPLLLGGVQIHPDFTILNIRERKEMYLEHFGMMDDPDYCSRAVSRIELYERNGLFPGDRLILTLESSDRPLNIKNVESMIRFCLKI